MFAFSWSQVVSALHAFFAVYRATFAHLDRDALMELFAFPVQVVSATDDAAAISVSQRDEWAAVVDGLLGAYRSLGVVDAKPLGLEVMDVAPQVSSARVHWRLRRQDGSTVYDFTAIYTVIKTGGSCRIAAIAHDELPKLRAAMGGDRDGG